MIHPKDKISEFLLASVPKKVHDWLLFLGPESMELKTYGNISWEFSGNHCSLTIGADARGEHIQLEFYNNPDKTNAVDSGVEVVTFEPWGVKGTEEWMASIPDNMELFIEFERRVYDVLEELTLEVQAREKARLEAAKAEVK